MLISKLFKWVGSNLFRTPLAADSWTEADDFWESKRVSKPLIVSGLDEANGDNSSRDCVRIKMKKMEARVDMAWFCRDMESTVEDQWWVMNCSRIDDSKRHPPMNEAAEAYSMAGK